MKTRIKDINPAPGSHKYTLNLHAETIDDARYILAAISAHEREFDAHEAHMNEIRAKWAATPKTPANHEEIDGMGRAADQLRTELVMGRGDLGARKHELWCAWPQLAPAGFVPPKPAAPTPSKKGRPTRHPVGAASAS